MIKLQEVHCSEIKYYGLYNTKIILNYNLQRKWSTQRRNIKYIIEITTINNRKTIDIKLSSPEKFNEVFELLCEILRYENLFDGRFFPLDKIEVDGADKRSEVDEIMLSYYSGIKWYTRLNQPMTDYVYKKGFYAWEKYNKKVIYINQMFYYLGFCRDFTSDLRLALFSEIYEPLSELLANENKIQLIQSNPFREKNVQCELCGGKFKVQILNDFSFRDRIEGVIREYGNIIFDGDDVDVILKKTVNTRNKILHVDAKKKDALNGVRKGVRPPYKFLTEKSKAVERFREKTSQISERRFWVAE